MNIHEFQAKDLLSAYGLKVPRGGVAITPQEAADVARDLGSAKIAVKAQIHSGARAGAGGVVLAASPAETKAAAERLLGQKLVTAQTGPLGRVTRRLYVESGVQARRTLMVALTIDRTLGAVVLIASGEPVDDADLGRRGRPAPERLVLGPDDAVRHEEIAALADRLGLEASTRTRFCDLIAGLHRAFVALDASLIEINPLAVDEAGELQALDVKMVLDDNALFRHPELAALRDDDEVDRIELQSQRHQINYVPLGGDIGIAANGAGLGLATVDLVYDAGGRPANFMDIRTTATSQNVAFAFGMLVDDPATRVLLVNVHGGGMQPCDTIAEGLGIARRRSGRILPTVARLAGNNADFARSRFASFGYPIVECADMWTAARKAVALARGER